MVGNGVDTSDATITPETVLKDYVGYGREGRVTGTYTPPEIPVSGDGFSVAKITEFIPYSPAFRGVTEITVSEIGYVGNQEEDWGQDYSDANGKYIVTEDTYYEPDEKKRIYKHESKNYWIMYYDDSEWENWGSNYWVITPREGDSEPYSAVACAAAEEIPTSVTEWYNMEYDVAVNVGIATTITDKPEQPLVLNGKLATRYNAEEMDWIFADTITAFKGFDITPKTGEMYNAFDGKLIGNSLGHDPGDMESNAVMYCNPGTGEGVAVQGRIVPYIHKTLVNGVPCIYMDIDTAGIDSTEHLRSRDNYAYIPLSKSLSISCPEYYPNPPPPFNQLSLVGTVFCNTWGNTSSGFFLLSKELVDTTGHTTPVDRPKGVELGIAFDPNYGFKVQGAPGYSSDYKKYYEAYNGKWLQFVLIYDDAQFKLYLNNELRVIAHDVGWAGMPWTDSLNYLFFRQPYNGFTGEVVYFGPMYAFDRVLSEAEISRAWKELLTTDETPDDITSYLTFHAPLSDASTTTPTGHTLIIPADVTFENVDGVPCAYIPTTNIECSTFDTPIARTDRTISCYAKTPLEVSRFRVLVGFGAPSSGGGDFLFGLEKTRLKVDMNYSEAYIDTPETIDYTQWHHYAVTVHKDTFSFYVDGVLLGETKYIEYGTSTGRITLGREDENAEVYLADCRIYSRALSMKEIKELSLQLKK